MTIQVTAKHIADGIRQSCSACPIALALEDAGFTSVRVGRFSFIARDDRKTGWLPVEVSGFIWDFDGGLAVEPFSFEIAVEDMHASRSSRYNS